MVEHGRTQTRDQLQVLQVLSLGCVARSTWRSCGERWSPGETGETGEIPMGSVDGTGRDGTPRSRTPRWSRDLLNLRKIQERSASAVVFCRFLSFSDVEHHLENVSTLHCINPYHLTNILCHEIRDPNDKGVSPWITTWSCTNFHIFWAAQETLAKMRKYAEAEKTKAGSAEAPNVLEVPHAKL